MGGFVFGDGQGKYTNPDIWEIKTQVWVRSHEILGIETETWSTQEKQSTKQDPMFNKLYKGRCDKYFLHNSLLKCKYLTGFCYILTPAC